MFFPPTILARTPILTAIGQGVGTAIGSMTSNGGLAAAFDGDEAQSYALCSRSPASVPRGCIGKTWPSLKLIVGYSAIAPADLGFEGASASVQIALYGSASTFTAYNGTDFGGTQLHTATLTGPTTAGTIQTISSGIDLSTAYLNHWVMVKALSGSNEVYCCEAKFSEYL